ncbi:MAG: GtrA family protein [Candidatus Pacebacteria bacterium]|nr:GtrA family protein [Candidatus Paceibacterota bacterium]
MKKVDIILALVTGEITAWFFYYLLKDVAVLRMESFKLILAVSFPVLALAGTWVTWLMSKRFLWIFQLAKYLLIGVLATITDLGVLNFLMLVSGTSTGLWYSVFKGISFIVATTAKYFGDKFWAFEKMEKEGMHKEFGQFFIVTLIGLGLNVGVASFIVNSIGPQFGLDDKLWANVGGIIAAFAVTAWNFIGYKFIVFKK